MSNTMFVIVLLIIFLMVVFFLEAVPPEIMVVMKDIELISEEI